MCTTQTDSRSFNNDQVLNKSKLLVSNHVFSNITLYIDYIIKSSYELPDAPVMYEDLYPYSTYYSSLLDTNYTQSELTHLIETYEDELQTATSQVKRNEVNAVLEELSSLLEEGTPDYPEVYEWYIVSPYLANQLKNQGEIIINDTLWGRQSTGQAIYLDGCITDIVLANR